MYKLFRKKLFKGWYEDDWFTNMVNDTACTPQQLKLAAEGHITTEAVMWNEDRDERTISGMVIIANIFLFMQSQNMRDSIQN